MNIGFLRSKASMEDLKEVMAALEQAGCERIVVDNSPVADPKSGMLAAIIGHLSNGDVLTVWRLDSVADSVSDLVCLLVDLHERNVRFRALTEGLDTHGRQRAAIMTTLGHLRQFDQQLALRRKSEAHASQGRRVGRPRSLSGERLQRARQLLKEGLSMDDVAKAMQVSRATLYRYLETGGA